MTGRRTMRWNVVLNVRAIYPSGRSFAGCWGDMRGTDVYTPLYDRFINSGAAPQELHAEAAACLDHLFCHVYTVLGKTNLTDAAWVCPTNAAHRFFKVKVEMP